MDKGAAFVTIGDELVSGVIRDTNSAYVAEKLAEVGLELRHKSTVPDDPDILGQELRRLMEEYPIVITSGGLGSTQDDVTRAAIAKTLGKKLVLKNRLVEEIRYHFTNRGEEMPVICHSQALVPNGATPIRNPLGTAPGLAINFGDRWLIALPGVPSEMAAVLEGAIPLLPRRPNHSAESRTLRAAGIGESRVQEILGDIAREAAGELAFLPRTTGVDIKITAKGSGDEVSRRVQTLEKKILDKIGEYIYGSDGETLEEVVGRLLSRGKLTVSVAESCTGGLIEHKITDVPGSSDYFLGGIVAYRNDLKEKLLGVPKAILQDHGAVSSETVTHMAEGVRRLLGSDIGIGTTGIAGPTGATPSKPVGLVYIGLSASGSTLVEEHIFQGERAAVKEKSAQASLNMLRRHLTNQ